MRTATKFRKPISGRSRPFLRVVLAVVLTAAVAVVGVSGPAQATDISIPFDDLVFGQPGSVVNVTTVQVDPGLVGGTCSLAVVAKNQASVHKGNDLIVSTGSAQAVIFGVEDTPNGGTSESYEMVLGPTILVQLRIGPDGMSSMGFDLSFDCVAPFVEATTQTIDQQLVTTTSTVAATVAPGLTETTICTTGPVTSGATVTSGPSGSAVTPSGQGQCSTPTTTCAPDNTGNSGTDTSVAGQAVTPTTGCNAGQVTASTVATTTTTTPTTTTPTTTTAVTPTVAGSSISRLPQTPAAPAVVGAPAYTG